MKPMKSIVLLTVGALTFGACSKKADDTQTTATGNQDTTMGAGTAPVTEPMPATDQGSGLGAASDSHSHDSDFSTDQGSGSISDDDEFIEDTSAVDEEDLPTNRGTGASTSDTESEYIDETSSEADDVRGGRGSRMVPKYEGVDNSSSEPDPNQM